MGTKKRKITILTTGGTIEKIYDEGDGTLENRETIIKNKILQKLRLPHLEIMVKSLMSKDSLHMDDKDRELIAKAVMDSASSNDPIVVLHGTDTVHLTMKKCLSFFAQPKVPVVFTGAMKPMGFDDSDATQNVVEAIFAAQTCPAGYYLTFHSTLFYGDDFVKDRQNHTFKKASS